MSVTDPRLAGWDKDALVRLIDLERRHIRHLTADRDLLAALLDGVLADDPQAIRDAAAWLTVNRPEDVDGGDSVGEGEG